MNNLAKKFQLAQNSQTNEKCEDIPMDWDGIPVYVKHMYADNGDLHWQIICPQNPGIHGIHLKPVDDFLTWRAEIKRDSGGGFSEDLYDVIRMEFSILDGSFIINHEEHWPGCRVPRDDGKYPINRYRWFCRDARKEAWEC